MLPLFRALLTVVFLGLAGSLMLPTAAFADDGDPAAPSAAEMTDAGKFVQTLGERAIAIIANKNLTADMRHEKFRQILSDSFDLKTIGRFVIGRSWNLATPAQQNEYMQLFQALVVKTYGDRLTLYTGEGFKVISEHPESEEDIIVNSEITHPDGSAPTLVDWRVRRKSGKLGIIDVVVEGVSLSVTQRQEYSAVIQSNGGQIDGLLALMRQRLEQPSTGSPE